MIFSDKGVGKSRLCQALCPDNTSPKYVSIKEIAKQQKVLLEHDDENECEILDDDAIYDYFENEYFQADSVPSGLVIDYHSPGIIPDNDAIHGIFVVRCSNDKLYDRLKQRNYSEKKIEQNIQSEIFQVCLDDAHESFDKQLVHQLTNETEDDFKKNVDNLLSWIEQWSKDNKKHEQLVFSRCCY